MSRAKPALKTKSRKQAEERQSFQKAAARIAAENGQNPLRRKLALMPKLISGKIVLTDGTPRDVQPAEAYGFYVARYSAGEHWVLNDDFQPVRLAHWKEVRNAGFGPPFERTPIQQQIASRYADKLEQKDRERRARRATSRNTQLNQRV